MKVVLCHQMKRRSVVTLPEHEKHQVPACLDVPQVVQNRHRRYLRGRNSSSDCDTLATHLGDVAVVSCKQEEQAGFVDETCSTHAVGGTQEEGSERHRVFVEEFSDSTDEETEDDDASSSHVEGDVMLPEVQLL